MSKIEVNELDAQCGSTITIGSSGKTVNVPGTALTSTIVKTNTLQASDGGNIVSQSGTTITLGASGDTVSLASGASQSGFGRTGTVDWQTGSIKTSTFTATNGEGYFCNTSGGAFTVNLPAGSAGAIVSVSDYTRTFQTNNLTVAPNGSEKIGGIAAQAFLSTEGQTATFVYVDATEGWINIQETSNSVTGDPFIQATGGTITTSGNCKIHTFTGPGTFTVTNASATADENVVSYLVVAGGASAGGGQSGGGGAGGYRELKSPITPYTASPLDGYSTPGNRVTITAQAYPITVGGGGAGITCGNQTKGNPGNNSVFSTITSAGGGGGGGNAAGKQGLDGGSGGGSSDNQGAGGSGNTPPVTPAQGTNGGSSGTPSSGGGGGGATQAGIHAGTPSVGANGGNGATSSITGSPVTRAGGGGGGGRCGGAGTTPQGGSGGGGNGNNNGNGVAGTVNTGGGGGGTENTPGRTSGAGGSGIVVIRYKFQ